MKQVQISEIPDGAYFRLVLSDGPCERRIKVGPEHYTDLYGSLLVDVVTDFSPCYVFDGMVEAPKPTTFAELKGGAFFTYPDSTVLFQKKNPHHVGSYDPPTAHYITGTYPGLDCYSLAGDVVVEMDLEFVVE